MRHTAAIAERPAPNTLLGARRHTLSIASPAGATMHDLCLATGRLARAARRSDPVMTAAAVRELSGLAAENHMPKVRWHARALLQWHADEPLAAVRLEALLADLDFAVAAALAQLGAGLSAA